jgi:para-aminobenzoate synthetase/4-amino-4-deoxychorismate lyase
LTLPDQPPAILLDSFAEGEFSHSWRFSGHITTLTAMMPEEVATVLAEAEAATGQGMYAVGFVAYEAAHALNPYLPALPPQNGLPLAWFALFRERYAVQSGQGLSCTLPAPVQLSPRLEQSAYVATVGLIHGAIAAGECYQINYTFPLQGHFGGEPLQLYRNLLEAQRPAFGACLEIGSHLIVSASPELFFSVQDGVITTRPMKGTAPRGRFPLEDLELAQALRRSDKERAENLMIVDLLRNDLGQIAETGSVSVDRLFDVEQYPSVHQMTSTITARLQPGVGALDIFRALFPCGSVTGAPKRRSMELITSLEQQPRGVYCGAIGQLAPGGEAVFSVAIRTLLLDQQLNSISMGVGSGITWGSEALSEYAECLAKAAFVQRSAEPFLLIETLRHDQAGFHRLERHLNRMAASATYFGFRFDESVARALLEQRAETFSGIMRVRLTLSAKGELEITALPLQEDSQPLRIRIADETVDSSDRFRFHKTSRRTMLDDARIRRPDCDEVLFLNERGELTEGSYHTLVIKLYERLVTPPLEAGLLPGVLRAELLGQGVIEEKSIVPDDLAAAEEIWLVNSLRGWRRGTFRS